MENITNILLVVIMAILGGVPSLYILVSMPMIIAGKVYRKIKFGTSMYD